MQTIETATRELPALLTRAEVCVALKISPATFYRLIERGDLQAVRLGRSPAAHLRIPVAELVRFLDDHNSGDPSRPRPHSSASGRAPRRRTREATASA